MNVHVLTDTKVGFTAATFSTGTGLGAMMELVPEAGAFAGLMVAVCVIVSHIHSFIIKRRQSKLDALKTQLEIERLKRENDNSE